MKTFRAWHVVILVCMALDLGNPHVPGIFSVLNGDLFMEGVTRAHRVDAGAKYVRDSPRVPATSHAEEELASVVPRAVTRDPRRASPRSHPHGLGHIAVHSPLDAEDH